MSKEKFAFDKTNFILLAVEMAVVIIGFILMTGPGVNSRTSNRIFLVRDVLKAASAENACGFFAHDIRRIAQTA